MFDDIISQSGKTDKLLVRSLLHHNQNGITIGAHIFLTAGTNNDTCKKAILKDLASKMPRQSVTYRMPCGNDVEIDFDKIAVQYGYDDIMCPCMDKKHYIVKYDEVKW